MFIRSVYWLLLSQSVIWKETKMEFPTSDWYTDTEYWDANRSFIWSKKIIERSEAAASSISKLLNMKLGESVLARTFHQFS